VDEALDALLQLDEGAVVGDRHHAATHDAVLGVLLLDVFPGVALQLLQAQADALALLLEVEHLDVDLVADLHHLAGMLHAAPAQVGDVQQAVDAAEVDERTEVGDVLDDAAANLALLQLGDEVLLLGLALLLEHDAAADHHVPTPLVLLDDAAVDVLADQVLQVGDLTQGHLGPRQERVHTPQLHDQATLDATIDRAGDDLVLLVGHLDLVPDLEEIGPLLGQGDQPVLVLELLQEHVVLIAGREFDAAEFVEGDDALALETDVEQHLVLAYLDHDAAQDLALGHVGEGLLVGVDQLEHLLGGEVVLILVVLAEVIVDDVHFGEVGGQARRHGLIEGGGGAGLAGGRRGLIRGLGSGGSVRGRRRLLVAQLVGLGVGVHGHG